MRFHTHPCRNCGTPVPCYGDQEPNHDGWPAVICRNYHLDGGATNPRCLCDSCRAAEAVEQTQA